MEEEEVINLMEELTGEGCVKGSVTAKVTIELGLEGFGRAYWVRK